MNEAALERIRDLVQVDVGRRGLRTDPVTNLISSLPDDFILACHSLAKASPAVLGIVTGFLIVDANPCCAETDGPLGALFLARALCPLGIKVVLFTDGFCCRALEAGLKAFPLSRQVSVVKLPPADSWDEFESGQWAAIQGGGEDLPPLTHLLALERVGPSHTLKSIRQQALSDPELVREYIREVPEKERDRCLSFRGRDLTEELSPAHRLFEGSTQAAQSYVTLGIGDGGNEIGMGKIPWSVIRRNIPNGARIACRVPTDYLIVAGISNWGAYALAAGVRMLKGAGNEAGLFDPDAEHDLLKTMVADGPLVDGVTRRQTASVDGVDFPRYAEPLRYLEKWLESARP